VEHLSDKQEDQCVALNAIIRKLFGPRAHPPQELVRYIATSAGKNSLQGFYRENFTTDLTLKTIIASHPLGKSEEIREHYYEGIFKAEYTVINVSGEKSFYRFTLRLENFDYSGIPRSECIRLRSLKFRILRDDGSEAYKGDLYDELQKRCPKALIPQGAKGVLVFVNLSEHPEAEVSKALDEILTKEIGPEERLHCVLEWSMFLAKQDNYEVTASYFTKGLSVRLETPKDVEAIFSQHFEGTIDGTYDVESNATRIRIWKTSDFVHPHQGGVVSWK